MVSETSAALLDDDRLFPADPSTRAVARRLYDEREGPADRLAARPHRSALVRRGPAVPRSGDALRRARPLHFPHALQPGRSARAARHPGRDGRRGRRPIRAPSGGSSPSTTISSAARRRASGSTMSSRRCSASPSGSRPQRRTSISTASAKRWRSRSSGRARCSSASTSRSIATTDSPLDPLAASPGDPRSPAGTGASSRPTGPTPSSIPISRAFGPTSSASASSPAAIR